MHYTCWAVFFWTKENSVEGYKLQTVKLADVIDHPINHAIYGDKINDELTESIREHGVLNPIVVVRHEGGSLVCLSGHQRRMAAKAVGLKEIPAFVAKESMPDWQQVQVVIEANRQRVKTREHLTNETEALADAKRKEAEYRKKLGRKSDPDLRENFPEGSDSEAGRAMTEAARETGLGSRPTAEKAIRVTKTIRDLESKGQNDKAEELRTTLNTKSVSAAHRKAEELTQAQPEPAKPAKAQPDVLDDFKKPVPDSLRSAFEARYETLGLLRQLTGLRKAVEERSQQPGGDLLPMFDISEKFKDLRIALKMNIPYTECFRCQRNVQKGCKLCQGRGWISEGEYNRNKTEGGTRWLENR